jgi:beta-glucosidase-like glycosyl hydrolase
MVSYSAVNFMPLAAGPFLGLILRGDLDYDGFVLSDNNHISKLSQQRLPTSFQRMHRN